MLLTFPFLKLQFKVLRSEYGAVVTVLFLTLKGGEINSTDLEQWDQFLRTTKKILILLYWIIPISIVTFYIIFFGIPAFLDSQLFQDIQIWLIRSDNHFERQVTYFDFINADLEPNIAMIFNAHEIRAEHLYIKEEPIYFQRPFEINALYPEPEFTVKHQILINNKYVDVTEDNP